MNALNENLKALNNTTSKQQTPSSKSCNEPQSFRDRFIKYSIETEEANDSDIYLSDYIKHVSSFTCDSNFSVLNFWKQNETRWPLLAKIAQKVLGVPASSAEVERMFSWSGHIFSNKRRKMKPKTFEALVFCKLNESLF